MQAIVINVTGVDNPFIAQTVIGRELTLSKAEITRLNTGNFIEVSGFKLFKQDLQIEEDKGEVFSTIFNKLNKTWHRVEDPYTALSDAFELNYNVLFFGKGGFGKSEMTEEFFEHLFNEGLIDEKPYVMSLGEGTTDDELFGGTDIKHLQETGEIRYLINNSFMNHKYVIFEEMFDAHPSTLLSLKDILTSKRFRKGSQNEPIKTKMIIGLTNKTKDEFSTDNTKKAFADRFQYVHRFEWDDVGVDDYITLFRKRFGTKPEIVQEYAAISNLIHNFNSQGTTDEISPRTAVHIMNAHLKGKTLKFIPGLSHELITKYEKTIISNTSTFGAAKAVYDQFIKVAEENSIILKQISPASPASLSSAAIMLAKMRGEDEVLVTTNFHNKQVISDASTEEFIKHTTTQLEKAIDALSDEKEKEEVTLLLAHVQLLTVKK